ncbi:MAG: lysoplasmalogenase family protein [Anaerocolumna sp.]
MKTIYKRILFILFILTEILLYTDYLYIDITGNGSYTISNYLKFSGIILCLLFTLLFPYRREGRIDVSIVRLALFFTVISDLFILMLDYYMIGLITFCVVQSLYLIRLSIWNQMNLTGLNRIIIIRFIRNLIVSFLIIIILIMLKIEMEGLILISIFYFVSIVFNVSDSIVIACKSKITNQILYAQGMVLFLLCDINVGLFNLSDFQSINSHWFMSLYKFSTIAMWMFYLPAQVAISLSVQSPAKSSNKKV